MKRPGFGSLADGFGLLGSMLCAVHCLVLPALLVTGSVIPATFLADESFHRAMLWIVIPAGLLAFGIGCWQHKDMRVLLLGGFGLAGLGLALILPHALLGEIGEKIMTGIAAMVLIIAHLRNYRLCRDDDCGHTCNGA